MRVAYADPPYIGKSKEKYGKHPDYAGEVDQAALIASLVSEFPDGWALSCNSTNLHYLLPLCPAGTRIGAWVKPFATFKKGVNPVYAWEPVLFVGGRKKGLENACFDWVRAVPALNTGFIGDKPEAFCFWLFALLRMEPGDELVDLFPGTGAVSQAWARWQRQFAWMVT